MASGNMYRSLTGFRSLSSYHGIPVRALEGSSNSNPSEISVSSTSLPTNLNFNAFSIPFAGFQERGQPRRHVILTLDPTKFSEKKQLRLHIGGQRSFTPLVSLPGKSSLVTSMRMDCERNAMAKQNYPPGTKAFLYYSIPSDKPRIAGELRLRVTSSDDHSSFESGSDLLRTNGRAWSRPLYFLPKYYTPLYDKLREDRLIQDDLDTVLSNSPSQSFHYSRHSCLYSLNDTFIVDFSSFKSNFIVVTEQGMGKLSVQAIFKDGRDRDIYNGRLPYTGAYTIAIS
jgi:hypothetical protein